MQTTFHLDHRMWGRGGVVNLHIEQGGHKPSPEESLLAPFFPDPSQRILVIQFCGSVFVMKTEVLLRLAQERGGAALEWEQWKTHTIEVQTEGVANFWVSGPRLFGVSSINEIWMDVHDFSPRASARYLETITGRDGVVQRFMCPSMQINRPPWSALDPAIHFASGGGHDSVALLMVNVPCFQNLTRI